MTTQNQYHNKSISLEGGLDLISPKLLTAPGTLTDCLNFEVGTRRGYSRIDGYDRFDGRASPGDAYTKLAAMSLTTITFHLTNADAGMPILTIDGDIIGYFVDVMYVDAGIGATVISFVVHDYELSSVIPSDVIIDSITYASNSSESASALYVQSTQVSSFTVREQVEYLNTQFNYLKGGSNPVPGGNYFHGNSSDALGYRTAITPTIGLQLFKDNVYAIHDLNKIQFNTGTNQVYSGDRITDAGAHSFYVRDVVVVTGTWAGGDAEGYFLVQENIPLISAGAGSIVRPTSTIANAFVITPLFSLTTAPTTVAGLYKADPITSWAGIDLGYNFTFNSGVARPNKLERGEVSQSNLLHSDTGNVHPQYLTNYLSWTLSAPATYQQALSDHPDLTTGHTDSYGEIHRTVDATPASDYISLFTDGTNYDFPSGISTIPSSATITGVEIGVYGAGAAGVGGTITDYINEGWKISLVPLIGDSTAIIADFPAGGTTAVLPLTVFGGDGNLLGQGTTPASLANLSFRLTLYRTGGDTGVPIIATIDEVYLKVYWTQSVVEYFFWNGADDVKAQVVDYWLTDGDWETENATGTMQVYSLTDPKAVAPHLTANRRTIKSGDQIYSAAGGPAGGGVHIATVTSDMRYSGLPSLALLEENNSRYQMIVANFYGNKDWEAIYGASGAGRGFAYDGFYLRYIYTGLSDALDKPRHVAFHQHSLALGFDSGNVAMSVVGEPTNYRGIDGAVSFDVGDGVTGLIKMNGTTLGVFGSKSIHGIVGSSVNDYSVMVLSPYEGAIEYTVVDMGKPIYCSPRGISVFEQTNAYGDFLGNRLSTLISPWLLPRLQIIPPTTDPYKQVLSASPNNFPVVAIPVRSKNQYRLWFNDGYVLTMTLVGLDLKPEFTFQKLGRFLGGISPFYKYLVPRAECSSNFSTGREGIFVADSYNPLYSVQTSELAYVYKLDSGWSFDGFGIAGYIDINDNFFETPYENDIVRKERLYGLSAGFFPLRSYISKDYSTVQPTELIQKMVAESVPIPLPREDLYPEFIFPDVVPVTNLTNTAKEGRSFSVKYYTPYNLLGVEGQSFIENNAAVSPPCVLQAVLIQHEPTKADI